MARTQLRLDAMSGSYNSAEIDQLKAANSELTSSYASTDMNGIMSDMASAIRRIHGADFASQGAGVFSHAITGSSGLSIAGSSAFAGMALLNGGVSVESGKLAVTDGGAGVTMNGTLAVDGAATVGGTLGVTGASTLAALTASGMAQLNGGISVESGKLAVTDGGAGVTMNGTLVVDGDVSVGGGYGATGITLSSAGVLQMNGALTVDGAASVGGDLTVTGNFVVNGSTVTMNSSTITVDDINIVLGATASPTDSTANGGGMILSGSTDKSILYHSSSASWRSSEHFQPLTTSVSDLGSSSRKWRDLVISGTGSLAGPVTVGGTLDVTGASTLAALTASGMALLNGGVSVESGKLAVTDGGAGVTMNGTLAVDGAATVGGTLGVTGASTLASVGVTNNATVGGTLGVTGIATFTAAIDANSTSDFQGAMNLQAGITIAGALDANGAATFASTFVLDSAAAQTISKTGGNLNLLTTADLRLSDQYRAGSTWSDADGIKLSATAAEWSALEAAAGSEISIIGALGMAIAGTGGGSGKFSQVVAADAANGQVTFSPSPAFFGVTTPDSRIDIYLNGQMMVTGSDYTLPLTDKVDFVFGVKADDVVIAVIR